MNEWDIEWGLGGSILPLLYFSAALPRFTAEVIITLPMVPEYSSTNDLTNQLFNTPIKQPKNEWSIFVLLVLVLVLL